MRRSWKICIWIVTLLGGLTLVAGFSLWCLLIYSSRQQEGVRQFRSNELPGRLNHFDPSIRLVGGFEASSYGGWHGDGSNTSIYLIAPEDIDRLIEGLERYHDRQRQQWPEQYEFKWSESSRPELGGPENMIPARFRPRRDTYLIGTSVRSNQIISIGKTSGYVCFTSVTT